jgi:hypothetical protein
MSISTGQTINKFTNTTNRKIIIDKIPDAQILTEARLMTTLSNYGLWKTEGTKETCEMVTTLAAETDDADT